MSIAPQYTYRQLTSDDVTPSKELLRVFGHAFSDNETYQHAIPTDEYLTNLLGKEHFIVVVALMADAVVGGLVGYVLEKFEQPRAAGSVRESALGLTRHWAMRKSPLCSPR